MTLRALLAVFLTLVVAVLAPGAAWAAEAAESADLVVAKEMSPSAPVPGAEVRFTITVGSQGPDTARNVVLADQLDAALSQVTAVADNGSTCDVAADRLLVCRLGDLEATGVVTVTVTAVLDERFADTFANTASVDSDTDDPEPGNDTATASGDPSPVADLSVTKEVQPGQPVPGERVTWTITVEDAGPSSAADVTVADPLDPALSDVEVTTTAGDCDVVDGTLGCELSDVAPSDGPVLVTISAVLDPAFTGTLSNTATVSSPTSDPVAGNNTDTATGEAAPSADLSIVKTVTPAAPVPGGRVTFTLTVDNEGPSTATEVTVTDALPAGLSGISATTGTGTCDPVGDDRVVTCHLGAVAASDDPVVVTVTATMGPDAVGALANTAGVSSPTPDPDPSDNDSTASVDIGRSADLSIVKAADVDVVVAGTDVTWTMTVRNDGPSTSTDVVLTDRLPDAVVEGAAAVREGAGSCDPVDGDGLLRCELGDLAAGAVVAVSVTAAVAPDALGDLENTATVDSPTPDPDTDDRTSTVVVTVEASTDLGITKDASTRDAEVGDEVTYTLTVDNSGPSAAADVVVIDDLPVGLALVGAPETDTGSCTVRGDHVTCALGDLSPGATAVVTLTARVTAAAEGSSVTNSAAVGSTTDDVGSDDDTDTAVVDVAAVPESPALPDPPGGSGAPGPAGPGSDGPSLARTGADLPLQLGLALAMLAAGAAMTAGARIVSVRSVPTAFVAGIDEGAGDVLGGDDPAVDRDRGAPVHLADTGVP